MIAKFREQRIDNGQLILVLNIMTKFHKPAIEFTGLRDLTPPKMVSFINKRQSL